MVETYHRAWMEKHSHINCIICYSQVGTGTLADDAARVGLGFKEDFDLRSSTEELYFMGEATDKAGSNIEFEKNSAQQVGDGFYIIIFFLCRILFYRFDGRR